ncbi:hypothetical protein ACSAZK_12370 [Methanosarcina sp. Mfa9]|uniref:hypothetical protein n=1 Tax=Methanosarcina sp. Mfa9 TaxID=3439063 RepID=UPI003F83A458
MAEDEKIEKIREIYYKEKNSTLLEAIPQDLFTDAEKYISEIEQEINEIGNLRSLEARLLENELTRVLSFLEAIFMKRVDKVIDTAKYQSQALPKKKISKDTERMLPAEKRLYELVLSGIETAKSELLGPLQNSDAAEQPASWPQPRGGIGKIPGPQPGDVKQEGEAGTGSLGQARKKTKATGASRAKNSINEGYVVVQILKDLPTFTGADGRNYTVSAEDVVMLPQLNATGLIKRKAAKMISEQTAGQASGQKG